MDWNDLHTERGLGEVRRQLTRSTAGARGRDEIPPDPAEATEQKAALPTVRIGAGQLRTVVDAIERCVIKAGTPIYQRGGVLVTVIRRASPVVTALFRHDAQTAQIFPLSHVSARDLIQGSISFEKADGRRKGGWRPCDLPDLHAKTLIERGHWRFRHLVGVISAPTLRPDGSLLETEGYDANTGLLANFNGARFFPVPHNPDQAAARDALRFILEMFESFPFVDGLDASTFAAAIMTSLTRRSLRAAPLFAVTSPCKGTGKSFLAGALGIIATGSEPAMGVLPVDENEAQKTILALLLEGDEVIVLDNLNDTLKSACLELCLTQEVLSGRILGFSRTVKVPTCATWLATGNNLSVGGDMSRRALPIRLDAGVERPWERRFDGDFRNAVRARRAELVRAALTVMRAYVVAGRPEVNALPFGGFEAWCRLVRDPVVWAGGADPCRGLREWDTADPERSNAAALLAAWHEAIGERSVTVAELVDESRIETRERLRVAIEDCGSDRRGKVSNKTLGRFLRRHRGQVCAGYTLVLKGENRLGLVWRVERAKR